MIARSVSMNHRKRVTLRSGSARGLTLVEMLVAIGLCGVMALMLVPLALRSRAKARAAVCANNLKGIGETFAVCLSESNGYFPDAYYGFNGSDGIYQIALRSAGGNQPDTLMKQVHSQTLVCPSDKSPVMVVDGTLTGTGVSTFSSYGYNVSLPLMFRNATRVGRPANMVTFYDGELDRVLGTWDQSLDWAGDTIRLRHRGNANFLFLDGHVERAAGFSAEAFDDGAQWLASALNTSGSPGAEDWA